MDLLRPIARSRLLISSALQYKENVLKRKRAYKELVRMEHVSLERAARVARTTANYAQPSQSIILERPVTFVKKPVDCGKRAVESQLFDRIHHSKSVKVAIAHSSTLL